MNRREFLCGALAAAALGSGRMTWAGPAAGKRWYRGNLHTHTLVSDGQAFPVEAALLYKRFGYDFLMLSDHNAVHDRELWITEKNHHRRSFFETHARRFAAEYPAYRPQTRTEADGTTAWRYGAFEETAAAVNEPGRFLLMSGCEYHNEVRTGEQLHCLGINVRQGHRAIFPNSLEESMAEMLKEHLRKNDGRKSIFVVNHPLYWLYDVAPTLLSEHDEITHFEVANWDSRPEVRLPGGYDEDKLWDYALARRCLRGGRG